jgi:CspA family cold shock protein
LLSSGFFIATEPRGEKERFNMAEGVIKWFSNESDYGYVCPDDGGQDIHVRRRHMVGNELESLEKGDRVTYEMPQEGKSLWARNVSKEKQRCYSWWDDCFERHEGKEARHEYYAQLEEGEEA